MKKLGADLSVKRTSLRFGPATLRDFITAHAAVRGGRLNRFWSIRQVRRRILEVLAREGDSIAVRTNGGLQVLVPVEDLQLMHAFLRGSLFEPSVARALEVVLRPGDIVVDGGAHIGFFTIIAAHCVGPAGLVIAFEPHLGNARHLLRNVQLNHMSSRIVLNQTALSNQTGIANFNWSRSITTVGSLLRAETSDSTSNLVQTVALDDYLEGLGRADVIKLDLEGAEAIALDGMQRAVSRARCVIFEVNAPRLKQIGVLPEDLVDRVRELGEFRDICVLQVDSDAFLPFDCLSSELDRRSWSNVMVARDRCMWPTMSSPCDRR